MTLPAGEVTFVMTDVEGSTRLWEQHADVMAEALAVHDAVVGAAVRGAGGVLLRDRSEGDSSFAVFDSATAALQAALDLQLGLAGATFPLALPIRARAAIHSGYAEPRAGSYYGPLVNRVVRLRAIGHGGQTLVSGTSADALSPETLPRDVTLIDLGPHRLKDLVRPEQVYELRHPALPSVHPPLKSLDVERNNLPAEQSGFVGRVVDRAAISTLLERERVVTVLGPGGVGKTRLALDVARSQLDVFPGGTWFVDLARIPVGGPVVEAVAAVTGVREQPGRPLVETVADALASDPVLLVLDNCEHVTGSVATCGAELLRRCAGLRILATSRERIGLTGERIRRLAPLDGAEAMELFETRSGLTRSTAAEDICRRVEGIPLAVEMAAAQAMTQGVDRVLASLDEGLGNLGRGGETTLRATIDWSRRLLPPAEQEFFSRLGVFVGPFDLDAVEGICPDDHVDVDDVLDLLGALVDASLLLTQEAGGYRLLQPVREFAAEVLQAAGAETTLRARHLAWYRTLAEGLAPHLESSDPVPALDRLELEHDNLVAALSWRADEADRDAQMALANGLWRFWEFSGRWGEGRSLIESALERGSTYRTFRSSAHHNAGALAERQGDVLSATDHQRRSLEILESVAADLEQAASPHLRSIQLHRESARGRLGELAWLRGDRVEAHDLATRTVDELRTIGGEEFMTQPLQCLGHLALENGDLDEAEYLFSTALDLSRTWRSTVIEGFLLNDLGITARTRGRTLAAENWYRKAVEVHASNRDRASELGARFNLAELALHQERLKLEDIAPLLESFSDLGHRRGVSDVQLLAGDLSIADDLQRTYRHYESARSIRSELGLEKAVLEVDVHRAPIDASVDPALLLATARRLGDRTLVIATLIEVVRAEPGGATAPALLREVFELARSMSAGLELARIGETAAVVMNDLDLAAAVDGWRCRLGAVATPSDRRWRARYEIMNPAIIEPSDHLVVLLDRRL